MKLIVYNGNCKSITIHGIKFTSSVRTATVSEEASKNFVGIDNIQIIELKKEDFVPVNPRGSEVAEVDEVEEVEEEELDEVEEEELDEVEEVELDPEVIKKLMKLSATTLRDMCEAKGINAVGTKQELSNRLARG